MRKAVVADEEKLSLPVLDLQVPKRRTPGCSIALWFRVYQSLPNRVGYSRSLPV